MAVDKLVDATQLDADLTSVANAIRTKGGTSGQLAFPDGFVSAIGDISGDGGGNANVSQDANGYIVLDDAAPSGGGSGGGIGTLVASGTTAQAYTTSYDFEQSIPEIAAYLNKTDGYTTGRVLMLFVTHNTSTATSRVLRSILYQTGSATAVSVGTFGTSAYIYSYSYNSGVASITTRAANIGAGSTYEVYAVDMCSPFPNT